MTDRELRIAIAREALGWKRLRELASGQITGVPSAGIVLERPLVLPDWLNDEKKLVRLESFATDKFGSVAYSEELGNVAGAFNAHPTARQRCEAVLLMARRARDGAMD